MPIPPALVTVDTFKQYFTRDFVYGATGDTVMDSDITKSIGQAAMVFNANLWEDVQEEQVAFFFAAAHFLVIDIQAAGGLSATNIGRGINSHGGGVIQNKSVGSVSVGFALPQSLTNSAILNQFLRTDYGQKYLALVTPRLVGNARVVAGWNDTEAPQNV